MYTPVNRTMHKTISNIELERSLAAGRIHTIVIMCIAIGISILFIIDSEHTGIAVLFTIISAILLCISDFHILIRRWQTDTKHKLYYCHGICAGKTLMSGRGVEYKSSLSIRLRDNSVLKDVDVNDKIVVNCEIDDDLLLIFNEDNHNFPYKIYRLKQLDPKIVLHRW